MPPSARRTGGRENLCEQAVYTGYQRHGGFAEQCVADARFCFPLPDDYPDLQVAPLLCAGLIGQRSLRMAGEAERLGIYGFGAAAHIVAQVRRGRGTAGALVMDREIYEDIKEMVRDLKRNPWKFFWKE